jgi:hypothetical protein
LIGLREVGAKLIGVSDALRAFAEGASWSAFLALAAAGTIAMAVLQLVKELTPARLWYQQRWVESWLVRQDWIARHSGDAKAAAKAMRNAAKAAADASKAMELARANAVSEARQDAGDEDAQRKLLVDVAVWNAFEERAATAIAQLVELSTGGFAGALYVLPAEEMVAQINQAALITLDAPSRYEILLRSLAAGLTAEDITVVIAGQPPPPQSTQAYFDARNRAARRMQRNLEGVRLALGNAWKFWMQLTSVALTVLTVELIVGYFTKADAGALWLALPVGIVGGYLAPVTRDMIATLQRLRRPL